MISRSGHVSHSWATKLKSSCRMSETALKADAGCTKAAQPQEGAKGPLCSCERKESKLEKLYMERMELSIN